MIHSHLAVSHHWLMAFCYHIYIQAWASALLVLTSWAMPEPRVVGRVTDRLPRFFSYMSITNVINTMFGSTWPKKTTQNEKITTFVFSNTFQHLRLFSGIRCKLQHVYYVYEYFHLKEHYKRLI